MSWYTTPTPQQILHNSLVQAHPGEMKVYMWEILYHITTGWLENKDSEGFASRLKFLIFFKTFRLNNGCWGFTGGWAVKNPPANAEDMGSIPGLGRSPAKKKWQPTPVFLSGKFHWQRRLMGYSPWDCKGVGHKLATEPQQQWMLMSGVQSLPSFPLALLSPSFHLSSHSHWAPCVCDKQCCNEHRNESSMDLALRKPEAEQR